MSNPPTVHRADPTVVEHLLKGSFDMHIHFAPDALPRKADAVELAAQAREAGMAGLVLKCHNAPTVCVAQAVGKLFPELRVFGGVTLNSAVGGLNPEAVSVALKMGGKVVWLPTVSSALHIESARREPYYAGIGGGSASAGISLVGENGRLKAEVVEIMRLVKDAGALLHTGHCSLPEIVLVTEEAVRTGLEKLVITHPEFPALSLSIERQKDLAAKGVYFERCFQVTTAPVDPRDPRDLAEAVKALGPRKTVMATDYGQPRNPFPVDGMRLYIASMLEHGIPERDIETMVRINPARLLGI